MALRHEAEGIADHHGVDIWAWQSEIAAEQWLFLADMQAIGNQSQSV